MNIREKQKLDQREKKQEKEKGDTHRKTNRDYNETVERQERKKGIKRD